MLAGVSLDVVERAKEISKLLTQGKGIQPLDTASEGRWTNDLDKVEDIATFFAGSDIDIDFLGKLWKMIAKFL